MIGSITKEDRCAVLSQHTRMATIFFCSPSSHKVEISSRFTLVLYNYNITGMTYLLSKRVPPDTYQSKWNTGYWIPDMRVNTMGKMTANIDVVLYVY